MTKELLLNKKTKHIISGQLNVPILISLSWGEIMCALHMGEYVITSKT